MKAEPISVPCRQGAVLRVAARGLLVFLAYDERNVLKAGVVRSKRDCIKRRFTMFQFLAVTQVGCRRSFPRDLRHRITTLTILVGMCCVSQLIYIQPLSAQPRRRPNFVFIMADDLGYAELGCYGQTKIKTPYIDQLAKEGLRFSQFYSGHAVCAPSRCCLMTGYHTGHAYVRGNKGRPVLGQLPIPDETVTLAELLKQQGYSTGCFGKWGLGGPRTEGMPTRQGFDRFFGYLDQWNAHTHYPQFLWRNETTVLLEGNRNGKQTVYSQDLFTKEAIKFIRDQKKNKPFFLYVPYAVPHVSLQVPEDSLAQYKGKWPETPFPGGHYQGQATPRAAYAAMVSRMDRDVGRIVQTLKDRGFEDNTIVCFTSDNGPTFNGGTDSKFFHSAGPFRGLKASLFEGGIRVPLIVRWPGKIAPNTKTEHISALWDILPTFVEMAGGQVPKGLDGIDFTPTLLKKGTQKPHEYLYWESHGRRGRQAVRMGKWKGYQPDALKGKATIQLYNLETDIAEKNNVAKDYPEVVEHIAKIMKNGRTPSEHFKFRSPKKNRRKKRRRR